MAATGPLEFLVVGFPGEGLPEGAGSALERIDDHDDIRIIEAMLIMKDGSGSVRTELVTDVVGLASVPAVYELADPGRSLLDADSIAEIGEAMANDSTALALVLEHPWVRDVVSGFRDAGGSVLASTRMRETGRARKRHPVAGTGS
jgi:hypothetical protein